MREGWSLEAARRWERAGSAWDTARKRAEAARRDFDLLSLPGAGLPPAGPLEDYAEDDWPDLSLPLGADDGLLDIHGRARI